VNVRWNDGASSLLGGKALRLDAESTRDTTAVVSTADPDTDSVGDGAETYATADSGPESSEASSLESNSVDGEGVSDQGLASSETDQLCPHGRTWTRQEVLIDPRSSVDTRTRILWPDERHADERTILDFWKVMFPWNAVERIVESTNAALPEGKPPLTEKELHLFLSLLLVMAVNGVGPYRVYWQESQDYPGECFLPNPRWGRFMGRNRFEDLLRYLRLDTFTADDLKEDKWKPIRSFVDHFNAAREQFVYPGWMICVDESMSSWRGRDGRIMNGLPHVTKIKRKPKGVGLEIKDACDVMSGIMLRLELCEGKDAMRRKPFQRELGAGTAALLRLTRPWWGSGRIVCADSAFASVKSAVELRKQGLYFLGLVKTATREFPKQYLESYPLRERGDHVAVTCNDGGTQLIGCAWNDRKRKLIVGTCGSTLAGNPHEKKRWRVSETGDVETYYKKVKRPRIVEMYFAGAPAVDIHNHYRQGGLALEEGLQTKSWWMRAFCTILGIIETDTYVAYVRFCPNASDLSHSQFTMRLAASLRDIASGASSRNALRSRTQPMLAPMPPSSAGYPSHALKSLLECGRFQDRRGTTTRAKLACSICKRRAHSYCASCQEDSGAIIAVCGSGTGRECLLRHAAQRALAD
jgi:hypothetical protein